MFFNRYKNFDNLLRDLSSSKFCDKNVMPFGVRVIFSTDGVKITNVNQIEEGKSYVCSSSNVFIPIDYLHETSNPKWKTTKLFVDEVVPVAPVPPMTKNKSKSFKVKSLASINNQRSSLVSSELYLPQQKSNPLNLIQPNPNLTAQTLQLKHSAKIINIIRNSSGRPRQIFQWLLNSKTAPSFGKVLDNLSTLVKLDTGCVKHLFTTERKEVMSVDQLFSEDNTFIAFGTDLIEKNDLIITSQELSLLEKYKKSGVKCNDHRDDIAETNGFQKLTEKYLIGKEIGVGNFSVVKECKDKSNKKKESSLAVKIIDLKKCEKSFERLNREIEIMKKLKHVNVLQLINKFETADNIFLVLEYSPTGNLVDYMMKAQGYSEQDISGMLHNLASGLHYIHSLKIVHRDIKFENILVHDSAGLTRLKICDFGLACELSENKLLTIVCGTPHFIAPEILLQNGYDLSVDLWSLGVLFYILLVGVPPFYCHSNDFNDIFEKILKGDFEELTTGNWSHISTEAKTLLKHLLTRDAKLRFTAMDVLNCPWISEDNVAKGTDLWTLTSKNIIKFFTENKCFCETSVKNSLARTALDKDSNYFEMDNE